MIASLLIVAGFSIGTPLDEPLKPIPTTGFGSSIQHWRKLRDASRFIQVEPNQPSYRDDQVEEIVAGILLFQRENGGWPKDYDVTAVLTEAQRAKVIATRKNNDTSYDNGNIHSQVVYLARAIAQSDRPEWRRAFERGFDFVLASQHPDGGFPQRFPGATGFHAHVTFNDGVMMGAMNVLLDAAEGAPHFASLDADRKAKARDAAKRGVECILKCQIVVDGVPTGWCQQHDEKTFEARPGRSFELASICPQETTEIVRLLRRLESDDPRVARSIAGALDWLERAKLTGIRVEKVPALRESFLRHDADFDVVVRNDPKAPPLWARHYEIGTNRPVFAGRDGVRRYALAEIERERRTGTPWYGTWPAKLLAEAGRSAPALATKAAGR